MAQANLVAMPGDFLGDYLAFTLAGTRPAIGEREGACANGRVRWQWQDEGVLLLEPAADLGVQASGEAVRNILVSAGVHGDETAPVELLSHLVRDLASGEAALACRLLVILGNVDAMRNAHRYRDDDLNRLFSGRYRQVPDSHEAPRAAALEEAAQRFFAGASSKPGARWHIDMHTAIRASAFERFALLPHTGKPYARAMFEWLGEATISAVLLHTTKGNTYSHFTAESCGALACTLELGKVQPFGENDLARFAGADKAVRRLVAGTADNLDSADSADSADKAEQGAMPLPRVFTVTGQITKQSDAFELLVEKDVPNFTPFARDTLLARDGDYRYVVTHDEERIVFPNPTVKPGLRAGLMVIDTTDATLSQLA